MSAIKQTWSVTLPSDQSYFSVDRPASQPIPKFYGPKNAFVLEVVSAKEGHEEALELLIEASFESFPERNYCCICVPPTHPPVGFLERFVRVPPRSDGKFPHELFVLHRNAVQPEVVVRMAIAEDKPFISEFLQQMYNLGKVMDEVKFALSTDPKCDNSSNLCFLMVAYKQIVGLAGEWKDILRLVRVKQHKSEADPNYHINFI